jgi:hypothetical protein
MCTGTAGRAVEMIEQSHAGKLGGGGGKGGSCVMTPAALLFITSDGAHIQVEFLVSSHFLFFTVGISLSTLHSFLEGNPLYFFHCAPV